ncbi:RNA pseudouridine synthase [Paracrocinitomix mangrovi]|uniref:RluA family pseudouridine synthase n=1 Tax=Paracrocinitomix mangrovi TaxID=2862509 RepID=UPI001C8D9610|nr:RNA pseudouridine synthase [Paracrocinitomix mangrovi]UKN02026.1 RNA pseudouridine synthase [Paracrocinitomix mangrovi]
MSNTKPLQVLYEDNHLIVINKRAGDIVQGDKTGDAPLSDFVKEYIKEKYNKPGDVFLGTVHRLDRPTTGIVLFARTSKALGRMNTLFRDNKVQKTYWAVTEKAPQQPSGKLINFLQKNEKQNKSYVTQNEDQKAAKKAELDYRLLGSSERYHLIEVNPKTGRHHQIRVQLTNIGCIIKGDLKYGAKRSNKDGSIHLHARKLVFKHPVKDEEIEIVAPTPDDPVWNYFEEQFK